MHILHQTIKKDDKKTILLSYEKIIYEDSVTYCNINIQYKIRAIGPYSLYFGHSK